MPTSSQKAKTIDRLPAITRPNMLKQNSERYWKKRWKRPRRTSGSPFSKRGQRIGHIVQFFVHVAQRVDVDARGDERDHAEHGDGQRVDVVADGQAASEPNSAQRVPIAADGTGRLAVRSRQADGR